MFNNQELITMFNKQIFCCSKVILSFYWVVAFHVNIDFKIIISLKSDADTLFRNLLLHIDLLKM